MRGMQPNLPWTLLDVALPLRSDLKIRQQAWQR